MAARTLVRSATPLPTGRCVVGVEQARVRRGPARARLTVGGEQVGEGVIPDVAVMISSIGMTIGSNPTGISDTYDAPFEFGGTIHRVEVDTERALRPDDEAAAEIRAAFGSQ